MFVAWHGVVPIAHEPVDEPVLQVGAILIPYAFGPGKLFPPEAGVCTGGLATTCAWPETIAMAKTVHASKVRRFPAAEIIDSEFLVQAAVLTANGQPPDN